MLREDGFTNEKPTELGKYLYKLENWKKPTEVVLRDSMGGKVVDFLGTGYYPLRLLDVPTGALWKRID